MAPPKTVYILWKYVYHQSTSKFNFQKGDIMEKKQGVTRRELLSALFGRAATEVKEGYKEGLAEQNQKYAARKQGGPS